MEPPPPSGLLLDVDLVGNPPRLVFSTFSVSGGERVSNKGSGGTGSASGGVTVEEVRHAPVESDELRERVELLAEAFYTGQALLGKLEQHA